MLRQFFIKGQHLLTIRIIFHNPCGNSLITEFVQPYLRNRCLLQNFDLRLPDQHLEGIHPLQQPAPPGTIRLTGQRAKFNRRLLHLHVFAATRIDIAIRFSLLRYLTCHLPGHQQFIAPADRHDRIRLYPDIQSHRRKTFALHRDRQHFKLFHFAAQHETAVAQRIRRHGSSHATVRPEQPHHRAVFDSRQLTVNDKRASGQCRPRDAQPQSQHQATFVCFFPHLFIQVSNLWSVRDAEERRRAVAPQNKINKKKPKCYTFEQKKLPRQLSGKLLSYIFDTGTERKQIPGGMREAASGNRYLRATSTCS